MAAAQSTDSLPTKSVLAGAYTVAQAQSGQAVFKTVCAQCHVVAQFSDANFQRSWAGRTARDLFELIRTQMPQDSPGSLSREQYAAVLAYIFELSGYPSGDSTLGPDDARLRRVLIERKVTTPRE
jgi:mono/diheme cytochrome c family protein